MKPTVLLLTITCFVAITACADDSTNPEDAQTPLVVADDALEYHEIKGMRVRLRSGDGTYYENVDNDSLTFRDAAIDLVKMAKMADVTIEVEEVLSLNGWEEVADEQVPLGAHFWIHPRIDPRTMFDSETK